MYLKGYTEVELQGYIEVTQALQGISYGIQRTYKGYVEVINALEGIH